MGGACFSISHASVGAREGLPLLRPWWLKSCSSLVASCTCFGGTYTKIGTIQRRLAWPLRKDDTQNREAFHIFSPENSCRPNGTNLNFVLLV